MARAADTAYEAIRDLIVTGALRGGEPLGEEALAEKCGVSRTPVREALRRLEAEMLVRRTESQRCFVAEWSLEDIAHAFELRAMLEGNAAMRAAQRIDGKGLARLRDCNAAINRATSGLSPDVEAFVEGNRAFHDEILAAAASPQLTALLGSLVEQPVILRTAQQYSRAAMRQSVSEHEELIAALSRRDGTWAKSLMTAHILRASHTYADAHQGIAPFDAMAS